MSFRDNKSILFWINIALLIALLILAGFIGWKQFLKPNLDKNKPADKGQQVTQPKKGSAVSDATAGWKTYTDTKNGFEFKYPSDVTVNGDDKGSTGVSVDVQNIKTMEDMPSGWDKATAAEDEKALKQGEVAHIVDWGHDYSLVQIKDALAKRFVVTGRFEVGNIVFDQYLLVYKGDTRIVIEYSPNNMDDIIKNNSTYFRDVDGRPAWEENNIFYQDVLAGKTDALSQTAYRNFNGMIQSFKFVQPSSVNNDTTSTSQQSPDLTYANTKYGFTLNLTSDWDGYKVTQTNNNNSTDNYEFLLPTTDKNYPGSPFASQFFISVYTQDQWQSIQQFDGPKPTLISKNSQYVFAYMNAQDEPSDLINRMSEVSQIVKTFKFTS